MVAHDLVYGTRLFARHRAAFSTAVLSLAVAFGLGTAMVSVANAWLLPRVGVHDPHTLFWMSLAQDPSWGFRGAMTFRDFDRVSRGVDAPAAAVVHGSAKVVTSEGLTRDAVSVGFVSDGFFNVVGARAAIGRLLGALNDQTSAGVVLSHAIWTRLFQSSPGVLGANIQINGRSFVIIGVAEQSFTGPSHVVRPALWLPFEALSSNTEVRLGSVPQILVRLLDNEAAGRFRIQATQKLRAERRSDGALGGDMRVDLRGVARPAERGRASTVMPAIWGLVTALIVVAIVNLAGFLVALASTRQREIGVRMAIGATPSAVFRQLVTESLLIGTLGTAGGWVAARLFIPILDWMIDVPLGVSLIPDSRTYGLLIAIGLITSLAAGLAPIRYAARLRISSGLSDQGSIDQNLSRKDRLRSTMLAVQIACSVVMVVLATVWARGAAQARDADLGFDADKLLLLKGTAFGGNWTKPEAQSYWNEAIARAGRESGVEGAALAQHVYGGGYERRQVRLDSGHTVLVSENRVSGNYFAVAGIPLLIGRTFSEAEVSSDAAVAVVSAKVARDVWGSPQKAVGSSLALVGKGLSDARVVGVVNDAVNTSLVELASRIGTIYRPVGPEFLPKATLVIRTSDDAGSLKVPIERALPIFDEARPPRLTMLGPLVRQQVRLSQVPSRIASFGAGCLVVLTIIGLHGVVALSVRQRVKDIAIRIALGAGTGAVVRYAAGTAIRPALWGVACGCAISIAAVRIMPVMLFGVGGLDIAALTLSVLVLSAAAALGVVFPVTWALRIQPSRVLNATD